MKKMTKLVGAMIVTGMLAFGATGAARRMMSRWS
jgi:hypothetical protein